MRKTLFATAFTLFFAVTATANEAALYDPEPPADASFVRVLNATDNASVTANINTQPVGFTTSDPLSDYYVKTKGDYTISAGDINEKLSLNSGKYYTIALHNGKAHLLEDTILKNPAKATLYVYNMTSSPLSIKAPKFKATIFENIAPGTSDSREINAVSFELIASANDTELDTLSNVTLKRRQGTSLVFVEDADGKVVSFAIDNQVKK